MEWPGVACDPSGKTVRPVFVSVCRNLVPKGQREERRTKKRKMGESLNDRIMHLLYTTKSANLKSVWRHDVSKTACLPCKRSFPEE